MHQAIHKTSWSQVWLIFLAGTSMALLVGKISSALPMITDEFDIDLVQGGLLISVLTLANMTISMIIGIYSNKKGAFLISVFAFICVGLAGILGAMMTSYPALLFTRVMEGVGLVAAMICLPILMAQVAKPQDRFIAMSLWSAFMPFGVGLSMIFAPVVLESFGWRSFWVIVAGLHFVVAGVLFIVFRHYPFHTNGIRFSWSVYNLAIVQRSILFMLFVMQYLAFSLLIVTYLIEHSLNLKTASYISALVGLTHVLGNLLTGWLQKQGFAEYKLYVYGFVLIMISLTSFFLADDLLVKIISACAFGLFGGFIPATIWSSLPIFSTKENMPLVSSFIVQFIGIGQFLGPLFFTAIVQYYGNWSASLGVIYICSGLGVWLAFWVQREAQ